MPSSTVIIKYSTQQSHKCSNISRLPWQSLKLYNTLVAIFTMQYRALAPTLETTWNKPYVTTQLREVEVRELKPKYKVEVTKCKFYYLSKTSRTMIYHSRTLSDQRVYEGQESTYSGSENLWRRGTELCLQPRDSEDEGWGFQEELDQVLRYIWVRLSWGLYSEYLGLYIQFWDRGGYESWWSSCEIKYTIVRGVSQWEDKCEI